MEFINIRGYYLIKDTRSEFIESAQSFQNRDQLNSFRHRLQANTGHNINFVFEEDAEKPINLAALEQDHGFTVNTDYEEDDKTIRIDCYLKTIRNVEVEIFNTSYFDFKTNTWQQENLTIELGIEKNYTVLPITTMGTLITFIKILEG